MRAGTERCGWRLKLPALAAARVPLAEARVLLAAALVLLAACRPLDPGSQPGNAPDDSGGIGGTGKGSVTMSGGGMVVHRSRHFETSADTRFTLDGREVAPDVLRVRGAGLVAQVDVGTDVNESFTRGTVVRLAAEHVLVGPVTDTEPLRVLGQRVRTTPDTAGSAAARLGWVEAGAILAVSGFTGPDNVVLATRVDRAPGATQWRLTGRVSMRLQGAGFMVGLQPVSHSGGVVPEGCGDGLSVGDRVVVVAEARVDDEFEAGGVLTGVTAVTCRPTGLELPADTSAELLPAHVEGVVEAVDLPVFQVDGHTVTTGEATRFVGGGPDGLVSGEKVEVMGLLDVATGALAAEEVSFP